MASTTTWMSAEALVAIITAIHNRRSRDANIAKVVPQPTLRQMRERE